MTNQSSAQNRTPLRDIRTVAESLAAAHRQQDPETYLVKWFPASDEVRLVEVSRAVYTADLVLPVRFSARPDLGVDYPSVVILMSPGEWDDIQAHRLSLPHGWDLATSEDLDAD